VCLHELLGFLAIMKAAATFVHVGKDNVFVRLMYKHGAYGVPNIEAGEDPLRRHRRQQPVAFQHNRRVGSDVVGDDDLQGVRNGLSGGDKAIAQLLWCQTLHVGRSDEEVQPGMCSRASFAFQHQPEVVGLCPGDSQATGHVLRYGRLADTRRTTDQQHLPISSRSIYCVIHRRPASNPYLVLTTAAIRACDDMPAR